MLERTSRFVLETLPYVIMATSADRSRADVRQALNRGFPFRDSSKIAAEDIVHRERKAMAFFNGKPQLFRLFRWRRLLEKLVPASVSYRPERHYMRGPGPKYRERHQEPQTRRSAG